MSKPNQLLDAVKTATAIHEGDYSSLRGKYFVIRDKIKKNNHHPGGKPVKNSRMDRLEIKVDQLSMTVEKLAKIVSDGFKQVNTRIDQIDARLDYNGLKKLPSNK